jgi:hypothetical protein
LLAADPGLWKQVEDEILADSQASPAGLDGVAEWPRLIRFLRETAPARRYLYPPAPEDEAEARQLVSLVATYGLTTTPFGAGVSDDQ